MLVAALADALGVEQDVRAHAALAARLAKADQASRLVGEFAELEGYVGAVYARKGSLPEAVAEAISEQYLPDAAGAAPPATLAGALVALADKLDSLATAFGLGELPTGSRDPYGLRRARRRRRHDRARPRLVARPCGARGARPRAACRAGLRHATRARGRGRSGEVVSFVLDRVDAALAAEGIATETLRAARGAGGADPLGACRARAGAARCRAGARRGARRARALPEDREQVGGRGRCRLSPELLREQAEVELAAAVGAAAPRIAEAAAMRDYTAGISLAATLAPVIDRFFTDVMVMDEDPAVRANRLRLMLDVVEATRPIGDLSALPG